MKGSLSHPKKVTSRLARNITNSVLQNKHPKGSRYVLRKGIHLESYSGEVNGTLNPIRSEWVWILRASSIFTNSEVSFGSSMAIRLKQKKMMKQNVERNNSSHKISKHNSYIWTSSWQNSAASASRKRFAGEFLEPTSKAEEPLFK